MGYWGPGNFDNDFALNTLYSFTEELVDKCRQIIEHEPGPGQVYSGYWDMEGDSEFLPYLEILCLLHETYGGCYLPPPETVQRWRERFLEANFGEGAGHGADEDYLQKRRAVVAGTFDRLHRLSSDREG
jgi:hypothetical protein